jgi:hypothetical protein
MLRRIGIALAAAVMAIAATPLILAAPANATVPCGVGPNGEIGAAPDAAACAQLCQLTGRCGGPPPVAPPQQPAG